MYRRVIYDFIWFRDAREGFEVFGDVLVLSVKGADQNWLLLFYGEIPQEEKKKTAIRNNRWIMFSHKSKETNTEER